MSDATQKERLEQWIAALRSGKYKQATGTLAKVDGSSTAYCCLGVACVVFHPDYLTSEERKTAPEELLPSRFLRELGLSWDDQEWLVQMNDGGDGFPDIAAEIESKVLGVIA